jgi:hypothetical protein
MFALCGGHKLTMEIMHIADHLIRTDLLKPPFVLKEADSEELSFHPSLDDILNDPADILWASEYVGYDSQGRCFTVRSVSEAETWFWGLVTRDHERRWVESCKNQPSPEEVRTQVWHWLEDMLRGDSLKKKTGLKVKDLGVLTLPELIQWGIEHGC